MDKAGLEVRLDGLSDNLKAAGAAELVRRYVAGIPSVDLAHADLDLVWGAALGLVSFAQERKPGAPIIRVFDPDLDRHGWVSSHTVIEIVNDDMPFLVDSVSMELARRGITTHLLIHPVLCALRDPSGRLVGMPADDGGLRESVMHLEIDRQPPETHGELAAGLAGVLAEVRLAVNHWRSMVDRLWSCVAEFEAGSTAVAAEERKEALAFLDWLADNHFTFLGYRRFDMAKDGTIAADNADSLGLLSRPEAHVFDQTVALADMPVDLRAFLQRPDPVLVTKSGLHSTVHRPVRMDIIGVKRFDAKGRVVGLHTFLGLFTSSAYTHAPADIPLLRRKIGQVQTKAGFPRGGHDSKALANILETYPRDELFQISQDALYDTAIGILHIQERSRVALFMRKDEFERFVSCLVFVPRDRYDTPLRLAVTHILEDALGGKLDTFYTQVADQPLARLHFIIRTQPGAIPHLDQPALEARITEASRSWAESLTASLIQAHGEAGGLALGRRWAGAFPASYRERHSVLAAVGDVDRIEAATGGAIGLNLYRPVGAQPHQGHLKLYRAGNPVALSSILPMLEAMGLVVISEIPHEITPASSQEPPVWIHDFEVESAHGGDLDVAERRDLFQDALAAIWRGDAESDGFNRLVLGAGLAWREVMVLRAMAKYLRQAGCTYSQAYMESALCGNPDLARALVDLFLARFDPKAGSGNAADLEPQLLAGLENVASADDDRILRRFLNLIRSALRTNYFQAGPKPYLAIKYDSRMVEDLPAPRPMVEVFVYSPRVEAIHLRGGKVARGGIRWSDRREDFRTEILGLMKAQMVKNAVIVPVGAKGGFVVKRPPATGGRDAFLAEGIECYKTLIRGLLDVTDNLAGETIVPPQDVLRQDGDDPYLVVAADKGTATFSDIANSISLERGFWLGDAFASGGSQGYDHKKMGITARGAWVAVERHFREMGIDTRSQDFTAIGVGDMSGDVFGNGMLRSAHTKLVAAFNHAHIFIDPDPDTAKSFAERQRQFDAAKSWPDYDTSLISEGGGVFPRTAKTIAITPRMKERFGIAADSLTPTELIRALLVAPVDLLFLGGIGTYVKAATESNADAGDRANDGLRVNGRDLKAKVVGEGANLGFTQLGRIEYAQLGAGGTGGRIDTDAIDNSAGVDCSDHEVNIKILVNDLVSAGDLTPKQRDKLLVEMTEQVGQLVLRDNYLQTQAISMMEAQGAELLDAQARFMRLLEKGGRLDRGIEFLPPDETLTERAAHRQGFTRPELAVLLAYGKIWLYEHILHSDLPTDPFMAQDLAKYFPTQLRDRFGPDIGRHRLRNEIIATVVTNSIVNRVGGAFVAELMETTGHPPAQVARAYLVARDAFRLRDVWAEIESLDGRVPASAQTAMLTEANRLVERATLWVLRSMPSPFDLGAGIKELSPGVSALEAAVPAILPPDAAGAITARVTQFVEQGVPEPLAQRVGNLIVLASAADILRIATSQSIGIEAAGSLYFAVGARFSLGWLRASAEKLSGRGHWLKLAAAAAIEDLYGHQRDITIAIAGAQPGKPPMDAIAAWADTSRAAVERAEALLAELKAASHVDLPMIMVAGRQLRTLTESGLPR